MGAPSRSPRPRSSGGRTLMLLGVLLALAAGTIVIYIVSQATGSPNSTVQVVVAAKQIPAGTELLAAAGGANSANTMLISDAFVTKNVNSDFAPTDALVFTSQDALNAKLNDYVVVSDIFTGEILRQSDPRLVEVGSVAPGSATLINPGKLPSGDELWPIPLSGTGVSFLKAGDVIDLVVTECNLPGSQDPHGCETQTTLQNVYVYEILSNAVVVVATPQEVLQLKYLQETGKMDYAIRKPGDTNNVATTPVDGASIAQSFKY
jgi:Flp pilus assembly protein CpaB